MATKAYLRMLEAARCTVNFATPNPFDGRRALTLDERVGYLMERLRRFGCRGYSEEYVRQLVAEDMTQGPVC